MTDTAPKPLEKLPDKGPTPLPGIQTIIYTGNESEKQDEINWEQIEPLLHTIQQRSGHRYVGIYSVRDSSQDLYFYSNSELSFSPEALSRAKGKRQRFLYWQKQGTTPVQLLAAYIPDSKLARKEMTRWLLASLNKGINPSKLQLIKGQKAYLARALSRACGTVAIMPSGTIIITIYDNCSAVTAPRPNPHNQSGGEWGPSNS